MSMNKPSKVVRRVKEAKQDALNKEADEQDNE